MKKIAITFIVFLSILPISFAQEGDIEEPIPDLPFSVIENFPVYPGCTGNDNSSLKNCMSKKIGVHVSKKFNLNVAENLNLSKKQRISVRFKIDKEGFITDVHSRASHPDLEKEAIRVIKSLPKMEKPGFQRGKPVNVLYALPIVFEIENTKETSQGKKRTLKKRTESY